MGRKLATPALLAGVNDPSLTKLHPRPDIIFDNRAKLLRLHTSVFAEDWTRLMGENFADHFDVEDKAQCSGAFVRVQAIDVAATGLSVVGRAWRSGSLEPMRRIVMVGDDDRVVGYGIGGFDARSTGESLEPDAPASPNWWIGDLQSGDPTKVRAYAVDGNAGACLIGVLPNSLQARNRPRFAPRTCTRSRRLYRCHRSRRDWADDCRMGISVERRRARFDRHRSARHIHDCLADPSTGRRRRDEGRFARQFGSGGATLRRKGLAVIRPPPPLRLDR